MYCHKRNINPTGATIPQGLEFLQTLLDDKTVKRRYSAICTARSALSTLIMTKEGTQFGEDVHVT